MRKISSVNGGEVVCVGWLGRIILVSDMTRSNLYPLFFSSLFSDSLKLLTESQVTYKVTARIAESQTTVRVITSGPWVVASVLYLTNC